jgi:hypothetical protein
MSEPLSILRIDKGLSELVNLMLKEDDVKQVCCVARVGRHAALYLIETPFESFPRYVVGRASLDNEIVEVLCRCNRIETARAEFDVLLMQHREKAAEAPAAG